MIQGFRCQERGDIRFDECLACAAGPDHACRFDFPIILGMVRMLHPRVEGIRVSSLTGCLRRPALEAAHDYYLAPENRYYAFRGHMVHQIIARAHRAGAVVERRFQRRVGGLPITGRPDLILPRDRPIKDYKATRRIGPWLNEARPRHVEQVSTCRWLVAPRYHVERGEIVYLDMSTVARSPVDLISLEEAEALVRQRATQLDRGLRGGPLPPRLGVEEMALCDGCCPFTRLCWPEGLPEAYRRRANSHQARRRAPQAGRSSHEALRKG